jgi:transcriptional regulator with XRE-family HTH domain
VRTTPGPHLTRHLSTMLRRLRRERDLSQAQLAALAGGGLTQQQVSDIEHGMRPARVVHLERLARALDVDVLDLLGLPPRPAAPAAEVPASAAEP